MSLRRWGGMAALALLAAIPPLAAPPAHAGGFGLFGRKEEPKPPVLLLAERIDEVEKSLNETGTIVAKKPDVWGESRLTKHRQEVEDELAKRIDEFQLLLNASVSRSDQAFFANTLAIQAALGGAAVPGAAQSVPGPTQSLVLQGQGVATGTDVVVRSTPGEIRLATRPNDNAEGLGFAQLGIGLEPTIQLDQLKRYLDHLNELRRLNEGGDTADAPGYALNLVRIPVSVMPGDDTRIGHGAEITVTAETHLTPELLPTAFRTLVIQDLVDQLALPVLKIAEARAWDMPAETETAKRLRQIETELNALLVRINRYMDAFQLAGRTDSLDTEKQQISSEYNRLKKSLVLLGIPVQGVIEAGDAAPALSPGPAEENAAPPLSTGPADSPLERLFRALDAERTGQTPNEGTRALTTPSATEAFRDLSEEMREFSQEIEALVQPVQASIRAIQRAIGGSVTSLPASASSPRVARYAVPPSRIVEVFGERELLTLAKSFDRFRERECAGVVHLSDARAFLSEELQAAYDYLLSPNGVGHWTCAPELALSLRGGEVPVEQRLSVTEGGQTVVRSLAWAVLVEAALLNKRLNEDMRRVSGDPECNCMYGGPYIFLGPDPPADARYAFMEYVRCRWPIQVFALDPVNQDQNIADEFSMRRELQLSAAVALASGSISASDAMRFTRQIALDQETIALNTTAAAFAHGANTFGWRFYPRFQTAEIESNSTVLFRDLLCGGPKRDQLIRDYRIEPGMRECVALVVMPSFVPHVRFDIRSNWFQLTDPEDTASSMTETIEMSRQIRDMQRLAEICAVEADNYRSGETERLLARVEQLSDKMPLQTVFAQVPYENTAGGFELFSSGVTDLGPELIDFYGAPGVGKARCTELFLVGKNFSVHETKVIAGNMCCDFTLLSRDVMKVAIPPEVRTVVCRRQASPADDPCVKCRPSGPCGPGCYEAVEVHLATPYGVSGRLLIPVFPGEASPDEAAAATATDAAKKVVAGHEATFHPVTYGWAPPKASGCVCFDAGGNPVRFCLYDDAVLVKRSGATPFNAPKDMQFAGWVEAVGPDGSIAKFDAVLGPMSLEFKNGRAGIARHDCANAVAGENESDLFVKLFWQVLSQEPNLARQAVAFKIHGFVLCPDCSGSCPEPVRLTNDLTIAVETCQGDACAVGSCLADACPSCLTGASKSAAGQSTAGGATLTHGLPPTPAEAAVPELVGPPVKETTLGQLLQSPIVEPAPAGPALTTEPIESVPEMPATAPPASAPSGVVVPIVPVPPGTGGIFPGPMIATPLPPTLAIGTAASVAVPPSQPAPPRRHRLLHRLFGHGDDR